MSTKSQSQNKLRINLILPTGMTRHWHINIAQRLRAAGHNVQLVGGPAPTKTPIVDLILGLERKIFKVPKPSLAQKTTPHEPVAAPNAAPEADLTIDLSSGLKAQSGNILKLEFSTGDSFAHCAANVAAGHLVDITARLNNAPIAIARPMIDNRQVFSLALEDVLARAVSLTLSMVNRQSNAIAPPSLEPAKPAAHRNFPLTYATRTLPSLVREVWRRKNFRFAHWRVGYRFIDKTGVAQTGDLSGNPWKILPDDGTRFYADPFPFTHQGKHYIFLEDYPHATGKAIISLARIDDQGNATTPEPIIEEPWHLSYPQVFARDGDIWMLPEASGSNGLILYRAEDFPTKWVQHKTLLDDCQISDATLIDHGGKLWLFATDRDGAGSTSDTLVVYSANDLQGPWEPHAQNPILIDRANARPGGNFIVDNGKILLPVQDGTLGYGGGLGLCAITKISDEEIAISPPTPIKTEGHWPYPRIHTLTQHQGLETIDGIAEVCK